MPAIRDLQVLTTRDGGSESGRASRKKHGETQRRSGDGSTDGPPRILLVEDDPDAQAIYGAILRHAGYDTMLADNGRDAIRFAERELPDLILMDLQLPVMNGWEAIRRLQDIDRTRGIPIVVVSASGASFRDVVGCEAFLPKPITPTDLLQEVRRLVGDAGDSAGEG